MSTTSPNGLKSNLASGQLIKADSLYPGGSIGANVTGQNMVAGIWTAGKVRTHDLLSGQVTMQPSQTVTSAGDEHMTHVTGTIVGKDGKTPGNTNVPTTLVALPTRATSMNYDWSADKAEMAAFAGNGFISCPTIHTGIPTIAAIPSGSLGRTTESQSMGRHHQECAKLPAVRRRWQ